MPLEPNDTLPSGGGSEEGALAAPVFVIRLRKESVEAVGSFAAHGWQHVRVRPQRQRDTAVAEHFLHDLGIDSLLRGEGRGGMAEVMDADPGQAGAGEDSVQAFRHSGGVKGRSVVTNEDNIGSSPLFSELVTAIIPLFPVLT